LKEDGLPIPEPTSMAEIRRSRSVGFPQQNGSRRPG
jgi:hypothetical protein